MSNISNFSNIGLLNVGLCIQGCLRRLNLGLRYSVFILFFFLSVRLIFSNLNAMPIPIALAGLGGVLAIGGLSWWRSNYVLYGFVLFLPLISGVQNAGILKGIPCFSFCFACIYVSWFLRRFCWLKKNLKATNRIDDFIDVFAGVVIVSILFTLAGYPFDFIIYRFKFVSVLRQNDPFWCLDAGYILLQGLFLFRILSHEAKNELSWILTIFQFHTVTIILFSSLQFVTEISIKQMDSIRLYWPFDDIHSYGSYLSFLFFYNCFQIKKEGKINGFYCLGSCCLFLMIIFSYSRITWLTTFVVSLVGIFLLSPERIRKILILCTVVALFLGLIWGKRLLKSENRYLNRLGRSINITNFEKDPAFWGRYLHWKIACRMAEKAPLVGRGIGTYYRASSEYVSHQEIKKVHKINPTWQACENAHNYFFQLLAELGIVGLLLFLLILAYTLKMAINLGVAKDTPYSVNGLLFGVGAYLLTMLTNHPLIISKQQFLFWFIIASITLTCHSEFERLNFKKNDDYMLALPLMLAFTLLSAHLLGNNSTDGTACKGNNYGIYSEEELEGKKIYWTMKTSCIQNFAKTNFIGLEVYAAPEKVFGKQIYLDISINGTMVDKVYFNKDGFKKLYYHIPGIRNTEYSLKTYVSSTFNPYKLGFSRNMKKSRDQGVALTEVFYYDTLPGVNVKKIYSDLMPNMQNP